MAENWFVGVFGGICVNYVCEYIEWLNVLIANSLKKYTNNLI